MQKVTFLNKEQIAKNTWRFYFSSIGDFIPGQYIDLFFEKDTRSFSIASIPSDQQLVIVTKEGRSEFKQKLFGLTKGEEVDIEGPLGSFVLGKKDLYPPVFIAGGIGLTPFYSMVRSLGDRRVTHITILASFSTQEEVVYQKELPAATFLITQKDGRITKKTIEQLVPIYKEKTYYIVGSEEFVYAMEELLRSMDVPLEQIKIDIFSGY